MHRTIDLACLHFFSGQGSKSTVILQLILITVKKEVLANLTDALTHISVPDNAASIIVFGINAVDRETTQFLLNLGTTSSRRSPKDVAMLEMTRSK